MKTFFTSMMLLIIALIAIPVGGMSQSNENHNLYIYGFLLVEILVVFSIIRILIINKRKQL